MTCVCCTVVRASSFTDSLLTDFNDVTTAAAALEVEVEVDVMESFLFAGGIVVCDDDDEDDEEDEEEDDNGGEDGVGEKGFFCSV